MSALPQKKGKGTVDAEPTRHDRVMLAHCSAVDWLISSGRLTKPQPMLRSRLIGSDRDDRRIRPKPARKPIKVINGSVSL